MKILLSIKPEFAERILSGKKRFEFRKNIFKNKSIKTVVIYATMPLGKVVGEFDIDDIISDDPNLVWIKTKNHSGITKRFYDEYFKGKEKAYAIVVGKVTQYKKPIPLKSLGDNIIAPQSYRYL